MMQFAVGNIAVVITDLNMRGIDGYSLVEMIRNQSDIPIIVATGYSQELGAWYHRHKDIVVMKKPLDMVALLGQIRLILSQEPSAPFPHTVKG
jgi:CheY-like chemotaxis protein